MPEIISNSFSDIWIKTMNFIIENGEKLSGITEVRNLLITVNYNKNENIDEFDNGFRLIFGDERIDFAKSTTFIKPINGVYRPRLEKKYIVKDNYFKRLVSKFGFNQIENSIKKLSTGKNIKTCQMIIFHPGDVRKLLGQPCLMSINCSPRNGDLHITGNMRSSAFSKSGYADLSGVKEIGEYIAERTGLNLKTVNLFFHTCHIRKENSEELNTKKLLKYMERLKNGKKKKNINKSSI